MGHSKEYEIAFVGLKPGSHLFEYNITNSFFEPFQDQDFTNCEAHVKLHFDKKSGFFILKFEIGGTLQVICDRCNNTLPVSLWDDFTVMVKLVDEPQIMNEEETDPDVYYIGKQESHLDVANWIYEFINLSIPMQKVCTYEDMSGPYCNKEALKVLKSMEIADKKEEGNNPIWKGLEKFKDLDN